MSEIIDAAQPQNEPALIVIGLVLMGGTLLFSGGNVNWWVVGMFGLIVINGLIPPPIVKLTLAGGEKYTIRLGNERRPQRAIRIIRANVYEFQSKTSQARTYTISPASNNYALNPEEYVRQYVLQLLLRTFGYASSDIGYEFPIKLGSSQKRADLVIFHPGTAHTQANIHIIIECKRSDRRDDSAAQE